jgi:hypothetical protein
MIDSEQKHCGYYYTTIVVDVPNEKQCEIIGSEWIPDKEG